MANINITSLGAAIPAQTSANLVELASLANVNVGDILMVDVGPQAEYMNVDALFPLVNPPVVRVRRPRMGQPPKCSPDHTADTIKVGMIDSITSPVGTDAFSGPGYGAQAFF